MSTALFPQPVIAIIWDFDETLIPGYMQKPIFEHFGVDGDTFWDEVDQLPAHYADKGLKVSADTIYLNHILTYVRTGRFKGLNNQLLKELGKKLDIFPGIPEFLSSVKRSVEEDELFRAQGIQVEHYIVSTGLRQMILGSEIAQHVRDVWGCEFIEDPADPKDLPAQKEMPLGPGGTRPKGRRGHAGQPVLSQVGYVIDNTTKTRAVFEINKGTNVDPSIDVNAQIAEQDRRVPFQNMIYVADGPSDIPVFSIVNRFKGKTFAVYQAGSVEHFRKVYDLQAQDRIQGFGEARYEEGTQAHMWITHSAGEIARRIVQDRLLALKERVHAPPGHVVEKTREPVVPEAEPILDETEQPPEESRAGEVSHG